MNNYVQPGDTITLTAPYAVLSGGGALVGSLFGVATADVANGAEGEFQTTGVIEIAKETAADFSQGEKVYWDESTKKVNDADSSDSWLIGVCVVAAGVGTTACKVRLNGTSVS